MSARKNHNSFGVSNPRATNWSHQQAISCCSLFMLILAGSHGDSQGFASRHGNCCWISTAWLLWKNKTNYRPLWSCSDMFSSYVLLFDLNNSELWMCVIDSFEVDTAHWWRRFDEYSQTFPPKQSHPV